MESRKIIGFGKSSLVVSLPKEWIEKNALKKGDEIFFNLSGDELSLRKNVYESKKPERTAIISADDKSLSDIKRLICAKYINNFNIIEIDGNNISAYSEGIKKYLRSFLVFEIVDENDNKIIAKDYLNLNTLTKNDIIRKMIWMIKSILQDCNENMAKNYESLMSRDAQINKYYYLMQRYSRFEIENHFIKYSYSRFIEYLNFALFLKRVGDDLKRIITEIYLNNIDVKQNIPLNLLLKESLDYFINMSDILLKNDAVSFIKHAKNREKCLNLIEESKVEKVYKLMFTDLIKDIHRATLTILNDA